VIEPIEHQFGLDLGSQAFPQLVSHAHSDVIEIIPQNGMSWSPSQPHCQPSNNPSALEANATEVSIESFNPSLDVADLLLGKRNNQEDNNI
jgi:hypothetical protein